VNIGDKVIYNRIPVSPWMWVVDIEEGYVEKGFFKSKKVSSKITVEYFSKNGELISITKDARYFSKAPDEKPQQPRQEQESIADMDKSHLLDDDYFMQLLEKTKRKQE